MVHSDAKETESLSVLVATHTGAGVIAGSGRLSGSTLPASFSRKSGDPGNSDNSRIRSIHTEIPGSGSGIVGLAGTVLLLGCGGIFQAHELPGTGDLPADDLFVPDAK